jgi:hypothetical protein
MHCGFAPTLSIPLHVTSLPSCTPPPRVAAHAALPAQVLLSQVHRLRALVLLGRFLDMGSWAVDLALSVGIFPYVLKLLQTTSSDLRTTLVFIWAKILALDRSCQVRGGGEGGGWVLWASRTGGTGSWVCGAGG